MRPFLEENWVIWEEKDFYTASVLRPSLDKEKDKLQLTYLAVYGKNNVQRFAMRRLGVKEIPALPVNPEDPQDDQYAPYMVLREQVMRESDYWVLKKAAFHAPRPLNKFAFCRLTGCSWISDGDHASSYRTCSCGLKRDVSREDIVDLCREMIYKKGPFQRNAARWLEKLADISDEELAEMASEKTERRFDSEPDNLLHKWMRPSEGCSEETDLKLKICAIFDAYIMWEYSKEFLSGSGVLQREAMDDSLSDSLCSWFNYTQEPAGDVLTAIEELLAAGGRSAPDLTRERLKEIAWNVCEQSPQHSYFIYMAYWYGYEAEENDDLALQMLFDAAQRGHLVACSNIVKIYSEGVYVHKNFRLALTWQEKKVELYRLSFEQEGTDTARREYREVLRQLGDLLMKEGYAKRAKRYYRMADQLTNQLAD